MRNPYAKSTPSEYCIIDSLQNILKASLALMVPVCSLQWQMHMMSTDLENMSSKYLSEHNRPDIHYYNVKLGTLYLYVCAHSMYLETNFYYI